MVNSLNKVAETYGKRIIFSTHPRTAKKIKEKNIKFNDLHKNIETIFDEKMTEGFKVEYKGKIYDYSI